jgi:hypothetical protein
VLRLSTCILALMEATPHNVYFKAHGGRLITKANLELAIEWAEGRYGNAWPHYLTISPKEQN